MQDASIFKAYRYRLDPSALQEELLGRIANSVRFVWNWALGQRRAIWAVTKDLLPDDRRKHHVTAFDQMRQLTVLKQQFPFLSEAPNCCLQQTLLDLEKAFKNFLLGQQRHPKFKKKEECQSFRFPDKNNFRFGSDRVKIPRLGLVGYRNSKIIKGFIKQATVSWDGLHWYISVLTQQNLGAASPPPEIAIGIDLGVAQSITGSDGRVVHLPVPTIVERKKVARLQRRVSRRQKGSRRREKAKKALLKFRHQLIQRRLDAMHKVTTRLAKNHSMLAIEDLQVRNMTASAAGTIASPGRNVSAKIGLNRSILAQAFGEFRRQLIYKCGWYGSKLVIVPAAYTSQRCSQCGHTAQENRLTQAAFACVSCRHTANADLNAACNILAAGRAASAQGAAA